MKLLQDRSGEEYSVTSCLVSTLLQEVIATMMELKERCIRMGCRFKL